MREALHTGVKRAMAVVCSGTDAENEERLHALIDKVEVPGERLAKLFEPKVLPPQNSTGIEDGGEGEDED